MYMIITQKQLDKTLKELDVIIRIYKKRYSKKEKRDWRTYEQMLAKRIKTAAREIKPVIEEAYSLIEIKKRRGRKPKIDVTQKVLLLLLKEIFQLSNRRMANLLAFFSVLTGIDISYKTVERCYSEEPVRLTIHNMFIILTKKKGIDNVDTCGDGTGYSLTITKHYRNEREKELKGKKVKKKFVYTFALMDLDTKMYIGYGVSMKSEKEAFENAKAMAIDMGINVKSVRLDKHYSYRSIVNEFGKAKIYILPKRNATIKGSAKWKKILKELIDSPYSFLKEYYKRNNSESGFSTDKRLCGWKVWQRREDRINIALMCRGLWHNLLLMGT